MYWKISIDLTHALVPSMGQQDPLDGYISNLQLRDEIEAIWRDPEQQRATTWFEHQDINNVMLATSLAPDGLLVLLPPDD